MAQLNFTDKLEETVDITDFYMPDTLANLSVLVPSDIFFVFLIYSLVISKHFTYRTKRLILMATASSAFYTFSSTISGIIYLFLYKFDVKARFLFRNKNENV